MSGAIRWLHTNGLLFARFKWYKYRRIQALAPTSSYFILQRLSLQPTPSSAPSRADCRAQTRLCSLSMSKPQASRHRDQRNAHRAVETAHQHFALVLAPRNDLRVPLVAEAHTRVLGLPPQARQIFAQRLLEELAQTVCGAQHAGTHLDVVLQRQVIDTVCVRDAVGGVRIESGTALADGILIKELKQRAHVLQTRIHALAIKGDHSMRSVAKDHNGGGEMVRVALDGDEREVGVAVETGDEVGGWDEGCHAGEVGVEERGDARRVGLKVGVFITGCEERACESTIFGWDRDEHELLAGPDVQMVGRDAELVERVGRVEMRLRLDLEFTPEGIDVALLVVHTHELHHVVAHCRVSTVCAEHEVEGYLNFMGAAIRRRGAPDFEPGLVASEVGAGELVVEKEFDVGHGLEHVKKAGVEPAAVDGEDCLKI